MSVRSSAHRVRSGFLRVALWASAIAFLLIESYALADQWEIGHASALFMLGTALLGAGVCIGLFALISVIGLLVSLSFSESAPDPHSDSIGSVGYRSNPRTGSRIEPDAMRAPTPVPKRKRHLNGIGP